MSTNSISKRLRTEGKTDTNTDVNVSNVDALPDSAVSTSEDENVVNTTIRVFTEDILPEIFDNLEILTAKDLLSFRLVNRCWRNAATSVLLKRNLCEIALDFDYVAFNDEGKAVARTFLLKKGHHKRNSFKTILPYKKFFNVYQPRNLLSDLSALISTSSKFPSTSIKFYANCAPAFGNLCQKSDSDSDEEDEEDVYQNQNDLLHFLDLYGKKIKKVSLSNEISRKAAQKLLYVYMLHLTCLDFQWFDGFLCEDEDEDDEVNPQMKVCLPLPSTLKIKEIILGYDSVILENEYEFVKELLDVCPTLISIQNVDVSALRHLLEMGKCHLIKSLLFDFNVHEVYEVKDCFKYNLSTLKLSKLEVRLTDSYRQRIMNNVLLKFFNIILSASKNSLNELDLSLSESDHQPLVFIPPLPHLKWLRLNSGLNSSNTRIRFKGDVIGRALEAGQISANASTDDYALFALQHLQGNSNIPVDYFPRLHKVGLTMRKVDNSGDEMAGFFHQERLSLDGARTIREDIIKTVTSLELTNCPRPQYGRNLSRLFPNVTQLRINCRSICHLQNWVWSAFPKLVIFQICEQEGQDRDTNVVDSFFTGISPGVCATLERDIASAEGGPELGPSQVFERTLPSISDCENLKEFEVNFADKLNSKLASKVTALHGFSQVVHQTKIVFSFRAFDWSVNEIQETRQYLDPVATFVKIQMQQ